MSRTITLVRTTTVKVPDIEFTPSTKVTDICDALSIGCFFYRSESCFMLTDVVDGVVDIIGRLDERTNTLSINKDRVPFGATLYRDPISKRISFVRQLID